MASHEHYYVPAQIIVADLIGFGGERATAFNIIIQLAAILAVVGEFRGKIFQVVRDLPSPHQAQRFTVNLLIAFFPA
ncbi:hypothetical protein RNH99_30245, partial [Pseudomonas paraeruginosa]|nr:hypothetical protein [Pseudomonas paraeruginosa]